MATKLKSRYLDELTNQQAQAVMRRTSTVIVPVGTVEIHGPHLPMGCDGFVSKAFALRLAEKIDALVAPMEPYSFIGATSRFSGGVSVPFSVSMEFLRQVVRALIKSGFAKIILVSFHSPNAVALDAVAREMFEETHVPVVNIRYNAVVDEKLIAEVLGEKDDNYEEATLCCGALKILGLEHLVEPEKWKDVPYVPVEPESLKRIRKVATVGYYFASENTHIPPRAGVDPEKGVLLIERATDKAKGIVADLDDYIKYLKTHTGMI